METVKIELTVDQAEMVMMLLQSSLIVFKPSSPEGRLLNGSALRVTLGLLEYEIDKMMNSACCVICNSPEINTMEGEMPYCALHEPVPTDI